MDRFPGQAEIGNSGWCVPLGNGPLVALEAAPRHFAPLLRSVVLIRQPALGLRLDLKGISLGTVGGRYQLVVQKCTWGLGTQPSARNTTCKRLFVAPQQLGLAMREHDGVAFLQPSQGRFLPRLRAAPSGVAFFSARCRTALMTPTRSPTISLAPPADAPEVFATPHGAVAGGRATTGRRGPVPCTLPVMPWPGSRVRVGVMRRNWRPRGAGPWPLQAM